MINVIISNNVGRHEIEIAETQTIREAIEKAGVDYAKSIITLDACTLGVGEIDSPLSDHVKSDHCFINLTQKLVGSLNVFSPSH